VAPVGVSEGHALVGDVPLSGAVPAQELFPITIVAHDVGPMGGMEQQLSQLVTGLLARGASVTVVSRTCELQPHPRLRWVRVPGPARPFTLAYPWFAIVGSLLVRRHRRGVLHTTGAIVVNHADVCTVHFCHCGRRWNGRLDRRSRRGALYALNAASSAALARIGERLSYRPARVGRLVAVSRGLGAELKRTFPALAERIAVIPNGVDTTRFRPDAARRHEVRNEIGVPETDLLALFVGSEWEGKGLGVALEAVGSVDGCQLAVVGAGDVPRYVALARDAGVEGRVHFLGERRVPERYHAAADVFVLPSAYETFSLVAYEAAAAGLPLLATRVHGVDELLVDGENGWFVDRDADALAARLARLRDHPDQRRSLGNAARAASERYSWGRMVDAYVELYRELADAA